MDGEQLTNYTWLSVLSACGAFLRAQRWLDAEGKIVWLRVVSELATAVAIGAIALAIADYNHLDQTIAGGMAGLGGLVGPSAIVEAIPTFLRAKFGGK